LAGPRLTANVVPGVGDTSVLAAPLARATDVILLAVSGRDQEPIGSWRPAAKAADREAAAGAPRPAFEQRLRALGYDGRAIARAYRTPAGAETVAETLAGFDASHRESGS
jgi:hypothetical protein